MLNPPMEFTDGSRRSKYGADFDAGQKAEQWMLLFRNGSTCTNAMELALVL